MVDITKIISYVLLVVLVIAIAFSMFNYYKTSRYSSAYQQALSAQDPTDKCKTPPGYTDESWKDHMSHHPDKYKECLS